MKLISTRTWDEAFFDRFVALRNALYRDTPGFLTETVEDLRKVFGPQSPFASMLEWEALLLVDDGPGERVLGRAIVSRNRLTPTPALSCGWFESPDDLEAAQLLLGRAEQRARDWGCRVVKTPLNAHYFLSYRIRLPGGAEPFYGEPLLKPYYHRLFTGCGFEVADTWDTVELRTTETWRNFKQIDASLSHRAPGYRKLHARFLRLNRWEEELRLLHDLFTRSYAVMPEHEPIPFECFRTLFEDYRHLANPFAAYVVERDDEPVGFCINYFDPLPVLQTRERHARRLSALPQRIARPLVDLEALARQKLNRRKLLISYVGSVMPRDGVEVKGIQAVVAPRIWALIKLLRIEKTLVCFSASGSKSRRSFDERYRMPYARYVLYRKPIAD
jgi:GNAT superfamily N-acetyltransferase